MALTAAIEIGNHSGAQQNWRCSMACGVAETGLKQRFRDGEDPLALELPIGAKAQRSHFLLAGALTHCPHTGCGKASIQVIL